MSNDDPSADAVHDPGRRGLVRNMAVGGVALGAGAVGAVGSRTLSSSSGFRRRQLTVEVACLGEGWREGVKANAADDGDFRAPFLVEGWIYPEGTIKGDGFIPTEEGSIGRWFCHGYVLIDATRAEPHVASSQEFYFGTMTPSDLFPRTMLATSGVEGSMDRTQQAHRAVVGGTGEYLGALGAMTQQLIATNTSLFADGTSDPSPCFRMVFDLRVLD